eukprot:jgi/Botrbrau1/2441/Bobra.0395s0062.1
MNSGSHLCSECFGNSFSEQNGVRICNTCGTQSAETATEQEAEDVRRSGYRKITGSWENDESKAVVVEKLPIKEMVELYVDCLQTLLKVQLCALEQLCGMHGDLDVIAKQVWLALLGSANLLDEEDLRKLEQTLDQVGQGGWADGGLAQEEDTGIAPSLKLRNKLVVFGDTLNAVFPKESLLSVLFLTCWLARKAIFASDIIRWVVNGQLPFMNIAPYLGHLSGPSSMHLHKILNRSRGLPSPIRLTVIAANHAQALGLVLPPVNAAACLQRFTTELNLPTELHQSALEIFEIHRMGSPVTYLFPHHQVNPHAEVMASLIVTIKMIYSLDLPVGTPPPRVPGLLQQPDWFVWAQNVMQDLAPISAYPLNAEQARKMPEVEFKEYLEYLGQHIFRHQPLEGLEEFQRLFTKLGKTKSDSGMGLGEETTSMQRNQHLPSNSLEQQATLHQSHIRPVSSFECGFHCTNEQGQEQDADVKSQDDQQVPRYALSGKAVSRVLEDVFSPEYASVLAVAAAYLGLEPLYLQKLVRVLERDLGSAQDATAVGADQEAKDVTDEDF